MIFLIMAMAFFMKIMKYQGQDMGTYEVTKKMGWRRALFSNKEQDNSGNSCTILQDNWIQHPNVIYIKIYIFGSSGSCVNNQLVHFFVCLFHDHKKNNTFNNVADPIKNHKLNIIIVVNQSQNSFMCETHFFQKHVNKPRITNHKPIVYCWALSHFSFAQHRIKLAARLLQSADEEVLQDASLHAPEEISARVLSNRRDDEAITTLPIGSMLLVYIYANNC